MLMATNERELRVQLAACYRIFDYLGWTELIYNHITAKLPGDDEHFLINPYGLHYSEITASNLVKMDIDGNIVEESEYNVNPAGIIIHTAIHSARHDAICIAHTHTNTGMAVACRQEGLRHDNFYSALQQGRIAYHDFEGITVMDDEKPRLINDLGSKNLMILRNHGLLTIGRSIPEAFFNMWGLQRSCDIQVATDSCGGKINPVADSVLQKTEKLLQLQHGGAPSGQLEFDAMVRMIDKKDDSYKN